MMIVGLTGGIGSGKSTVARFFSEMGIPVYIADDEAKRLMQTSKVIRRKLTALLGEEAYTENGLNREYVASKIFSDAALLEATNKIIHPKVGQHFKRWVKKQKGTYVIKEAAILFENGGYESCDATILVTAPREVRIRRVMERDTTNKLAIEKRMLHQWDDEKKLQMADFHIQNINLLVTKAEVLKLHKTLLTLSQFA